MEIRRPVSESQAVEIIGNSLRVIFGQIEYYRGIRKKAWNGEFVDHVKREAEISLQWLRDNEFQFQIDLEREACAQVALCLDEDAGVSIAAGIRARKEITLK